MCEKFSLSVPVLVTVSQTFILGRQNNDLSGNDRYVAPVYDESDINKKKMPYINM